jgi:hypothetical protein
MKTPTLPSPEAAVCEATQARASEINQLHSEVQRLSAESRQSLDGALAAALAAGRLLREQKEHLRRALGRGVWDDWLKTCFRGSRSTAYRYMQLARATPGKTASAALHGLSLRQAYLRLGIAIEPKTVTQHSVTALIPEPVILAQKLTRFLRRQRALRGSYRDELATLYRQLQLMFG